MISVEDLIASIATKPSPHREDLWATLLRTLDARNVLELGVWRGGFAERLLRECSDIERYYMLDPWRHLEDWNKPSNVDQVTFDSIYAEALAKTYFAHEKRVILRGTTSETIDYIPDESLDVAYIDGDHTLRGIAIDLIRTYPKLKVGGVLGGDDFTKSIWQHAETFEPSLVNPFAVYFAESQCAPLIVLPHDQFAIVKVPKSDRTFRVIDTTRGDHDRTLLSQIAKPT